MRDSVVFYRSFYEAIKDLPEEQFAACCRAIIEYGLDEIIIDSPGIAKSIFMMAKPQIDANNKRYINGTKGGRPRINNQEITKQNQEITKSKPKEKENVKVKKENSLSGVKEKAHFVPPTLENVMGYCQEHGYNVDAEYFIDFYASKGWMIGKNKMKDWKATVRNWARQEERKKSAKIEKKQNGFHNFKERDFDCDALVSELNGF